MGRLVHNLMTLSLVAAVLAGSLISPGVHHAHSQGDVPHSHDVVAAHDDHHGHSHDDSQADHGYHHHHSEIPVSGDLIDLVSHWHVSLLGIDFTFPQEGEPGEPLTQLDGELVVLRLTPDVVVSVAVALADLVDLSSDVAVLAVRSDADEPRLAMSRVRPAGCTLLCDSARGERSGVLLI